MHVEIKNVKNESLPGVAFLRGGSVAILMILRPSDSKDERWVIMTEQRRIPAGSLTFIEIPAGMIDEESFSGAAAKEIQEETGLVIPKHELLDLAELALGKQVKAEERTPPPIFSHSLFPIPLIKHISHILFQNQQCIPVPIAQMSISLSFFQKKSFIDKKLRI
jgi:8-oxo-dGTP pyrophosphatase MutT (NUDIX family)